LTISIDKINNDCFIKNKRASNKHKHAVIEKDKRTGFLIDRHHNDDGHTSSSQGKRERESKGKGGMTDY
jgi:hypothetical protein